MKEILKQVELIEGMQLDTRTECFMQLQQVKKLKLLLQEQVKNCNLADVGKSVCAKCQIIIDETANCPLLDKCINDLNHLH